MRWTLAFLFLTLVIPSLAETATPAADRGPVWFPDLGRYQRGVTAASQEAKDWWDQGFTFYYAFNHQEAIESFQKVAELDPDCAMAYYGNGPGRRAQHQQPGHGRGQLEAGLRLRAARAGDGRRPGWSAALIEALAHRYAWPAPEDRTELNQAYADAMREVWTQYPDDPDVGALLRRVADGPASLGSLDPRRGGPAGDGRGHAGAGDGDGHGPHASRGEPLLHPHHGGVAVPGEGQGPRPTACGTWSPGPATWCTCPGTSTSAWGTTPAAILANQKGIAADLAYVAATGRGGFYTLYRAHNYHFLAYAAMFDGQKALAVQAARDMIEQIPLELVRAYPDFLDAFLSVPVHVLVRFGMWEELLQEPEPPADLYASVAFWHYGRTVALSSLGRTDEAAAEWEALQKAAAAVPESRLWGNNPMSDVVEIGLLMAEGELEYRRGNVDRAFELLREGVKRDDDLRYDEPWGWMQPVRHALGALLVEQGRMDEAEAVYAQGPGAPSRERLGAPGARDLPAAARGDPGGRRHPRRLRQGLGAFGHRDPRLVLLRGDEDGEVGESAAAGAGRRRGVRGTSSPAPGCGRLPWPGRGGLMRGGAGRGSGCRRPRPGGGDRRVRVGIGQRPPGQDNFPRPFAPTRIRWSRPTPASPWISTAPSGARTRRRAGTSSSRPSASPPPSPWPMPGPGGDRGPDGPGLPLLPGAGPVPSGLRGAAPEPGGGSGIRRLPPRSGQPALGADRIPAPPRLRASHQRELRGRTQPARLRRPREPRAGSSTTGWRKRPRGRSRTWSPRT